MQADKAHILVVEDDPSLSVWISDYLTDHGYQVSIANRGDAAIELIEIDDPDIVVLDVMLPGANGFEVCRAVRKFYTKPIIMLTACSDESDEVQGLEAGADDYVSKPVRPKILLARVKALLRRNSETVAEDCRVFGALYIDAKSKTVTIEKEPISLSTNEFDVLWLLASRAGEVISRTDMVNELRGIDYDGFDRSIDIRISRLRKKLSDDPNQPRKIKTVWGKGYLFAKDAW